MAGVALGLAKTVAAKFSLWGPEFSSLLVAVVVLNQLSEHGFSLPNIYVQRFWSYVDNALLAQLDRRFSRRRCFMLGKLIPL
eukprot:SAG31_NODE_10537_length_1127_cov_1.215953_2_plen_82_part_00